MKHLYESTVNFLIDFSHYGLTPCHLGGDNSSACSFGSSAVLGSFGEPSVASRRKRGPVAFRLRLSAGLALSVLLVL